MTIAVFTTAWFPIGIGELASSDSKDTKVARLVSMRGMLIGRDLGTVGGHQVAMVTGSLTPGKHQSLMARACPHSLAGVTKGSTQNLR